MYTIINTVIECSLIFNDKMAADEEIGIYILLLIIGHQSY
jgi:hypothetical protein